jgi:hypothetical protein
MAEQIFTKFVMDVMPFEAAPIFTVGNTNVMEAQNC